MWPKDTWDVVVDQIGTIREIMDVLPELLILHTEGEDVSSTSTCIIHVNFKLMESNGEEEIQEPSGTYAE